MRAYPLLGHGGGGFLGPKWHSPIGSMAFHRAQKSLDFQGPKGIGEDRGKRNVGDEGERWSRKIRGGGQETGERGLYRGWGMECRG